MPVAHDRLSEALKSWRSDRPPEGRLSEATRGRILAAAHQARAGERPRALTDLFLPLRGWALAGALPVALLAAVLVWGLWPVGGPPPGPGTGPMLRASRVGDEVVFEIANGGRPHTVHRSGRADDLGGGQPLAVSEGRFRDRIDAGGNLVFYRID